MSQENIEIVRTGYEALNKGDVDAVLQVFAPDIEVHLPEGGINAGILSGHQGVREFLQGYSEAFESYQIEPERFVDADDRIVAFCRHSGLGRSSGIEVENYPAHVWTMRAGKAVRLDVFPERVDVLEAVGLRE